MEYVDCFSVNRPLFLVQLVRTVNLDDDYDDRRCLNQCENQFDFIMRKFIIKYDKTANYLLS